VHLRSDLRLIAPKSETRQREPHPTTWCMEEKNPSCAWKSRGQRKPSIRELNWVIDRHVGLRRRWHATERPRARLALSFSVETGNDAPLRRFPVSPPSPPYVGDAATTPEVCSIISFWQPSP